MAADLPEIGVAFDTSGLVQGEKAMDRATAQATRLSGAAAAVGSAATKMGKEYQQAAAVAQKQMQVMEQQTNTLTRSVAQNAQAMRMLPAQITDIFVGLTTGQSPMMVMLQQGGQLKDMFGGIGAAARAVGGYVLGLVNPFTVGAAAVAALVVASQMGSLELERMQRAIILSGNQAGTTANQMQTMATNISEVVGTTGKASETLALMVQSGKIDSQYLQRYAELAIRLDRLGIESKDTVDDLAALGRDPVQAALKLNEQFNFLEVSTYRQIKALQELGKVNEAGEVAQKAYAQAMETRAGQMEGNLGTIQKGWNLVKDAAKGAWDAMLGIGRPQTIEEQISIVQRNLNERRQRNQSLGIGDAQGNTAMTNQAAEEERRLFRMKEIQEGSAAAQKAQADQLRAVTEFDKIREASLPRQEKVQRDIARAIQLGKDGLVDQKEVDQVISNLSSEEAKRGIEAQIERLNGVQQALEVRTKSILNDLDTQRRTGALNEQQYIEQVANAELSAMHRRRAMIDQQIALKSKERDSEQAVAALRRQADVEDSQIAARRKQLENDIIKLIYDRKLATDLLVKAQQEQAQQEEAMARVAADKRFNDAQLEVAKYAQNLQDANDEAAFQLTLIGKTADEQARLNEQHRIENALRDQKRRIEERSRGENLRGDQVQELNQSAEEAAAKAIEGIDTNLYVRKWKTANQQVAESLYDVLTRQGGAARDKLKALFEQLVLRPVLMPMMQQAAGGLLGAFGFGGGGGAQTGGFGALQGAIGGLGGAGSLFGGSLGMFGQAAGVTMSNGLIAGFGANMANIGTLASMGTGAGIMGAIGAAVPYVGAALAVASLLGIGGHKGGPKEESGFGLGVAHRGNAASAKAVADAIQQQFAALGGTGNLDLGVFTATDPKGTAKTQLDVQAALNGRSIYSRGGRLGGIENVGRSPEELQAAIAEETERVVLIALQQSGLTGAVGDYLKQLGDLNTLSGGSLDEAYQRVSKIKTDQAQLETKLAELQGTAEENLARQRKAELDAVDDLLKPMVKQIQMLEDVAKAQEDLTKAKDELLNAYNREIDFAQSIRNYLGSSGTVTGQDFRSTLAAARAGDANARQNLTNVADAYLKARLDSASSSFEQTLATAEVRGALAQLAAETEAAAGKLKDLGITTDNTDKSYTKALDDYYAAKSKADSASGAATAAGLKVPGFARGTPNFPGGIRAVGERGMELEFTGPSRIVSNEDTRSMLRGDNIVNAVENLGRTLRAQQSALEGIALKTAQNESILNDFRIRGIPVRNTDDGLTPLEVKTVV